MRLVVDLRFSYVVTLTTIRSFVRKNGPAALEALAALANSLPNHFDCTTTYEDETAGSGPITLLLGHPRVGEFARSRFDGKCPAWRAVWAAAATSARFLAAKTAAEEAAAAEAEAEAAEADRVGEVLDGCGYGPITEEAEEDAEANRAPLEMVPLDKFLRG